MSNRKFILTAFVLFVLSVCLIWREIKLTDTRDILAALMAVLAAYCGFNLYEKNRGIK